MRIILAALMWLSILAPACAGEAGSIAHSNCDQLFNNRALDPIRGKISINGERITPSMEYNINTPTHREIEALKIYKRAEARCVYGQMLTVFPGRYKTKAEKSDLFTRLLSEIGKTIDPLIARSVNYGYYNREMIKIQEAGKKLLAEGAAPQESASAPSRASPVTLDCPVKNAYHQWDIVLTIDYSAGTVNGYPAKFSPDTISWSAPDNSPDDPITSFNYELNRYSGFLAVTGGRYFGVSGYCVATAHRKF